MKAALFFAAIGLVAAQDLSGIPTCALKCLQEYIPQAGCDLDDTACQCEPSFQSKLLPIITPCLTKACEISDLVKAQSAAAESCKAFAKTAGAGSAAASTTAAAAASTTTVAAVTSVSIDTSVTGYATVPAIFSSVPESEASPIAPVTPRPHNGTAATPTGTSSPTSVVTNAGAAAVPAFGLLAAAAAFVAL
ncbi:cell wall protein [Fusarium heterosporum]|uniref:Cell wall protein n=1 Tax=Fusarium heterosporum TaxID=42747 RepID=A0A8H5SS26_FUSHE|nr:cell wall protein [Fusarium heterosporum]